MNANDKIILEQIVEQVRNDRAESMTKPEFFELFVSEQVLKDFDLGHDEIESGIVSGGNDGGIDSIYVLVNGDLAREDFESSLYKKNMVQIDIVIMQSKFADSFNESAVEKLSASTDDLFDLSKNLDSMRSVYNQGLRSSIAIFRAVHTELASKFPNLRFRYVYATKGDQPHPNVTRKAELLKGKMKNLFSNAEVQFEFFGASELLALARKERQTAYTLTLAENPISSDGDIGYVALVKLRNFAAFIRDADGKLRRDLFEANVRDYQGSTTVNSEISSSLRTKGREDFWWLNNGVTIVAEAATISAKTLTIDHPQIVNGLQTSHEIYAYFSEANTEGDERNLLVRIIVPKVAESRDRVIKATNSQTTMPPASLRATEKIHRDIEEHLYPYGIFYDRRKNYYKNEGRQISQIVGIPRMAQSVMSILLQRPDDARARPSSLLKKDDDYSRVFSTSTPIPVYKVCASLVMKIDKFMRNDTSLNAQDRNNLLFYVAMRISSMTTMKLSPTANEIGDINVDDINNKVIRDNINAVKTLYDSLGGGDQIAKGSQLVVALKDEIQAKLN